MEVTLLKHETVNLKYAQCELRIRNWEVFTVNGKEVSLAPKEYELLMYFIDNKEIVLSRDRILDSIWGMDYEGYDRTVDTHVKKLRKCLGKAGYHIETVIKAGYVWK